jgi:hypothetical protein
VIDEMGLQEVFGPRGPGKYISKEEAARLLGIDRSTVDKLFRAAAPDGGPIIWRVTAHTQKTRNVWHLDDASFRRFRQSCWTLAQAAQEANIGPRELERQLAAAGIKPTVNAHRREFRFYPRVAI